jgi:hypothetical protein
MKKMKKLNLLLGTLLATVALSHAVDSYSDVVGYNKISAPIGSSFQSFNFVNQSQYKGSIASVSGVNLSLSGMSGVSNNQWAATDGLPEDSGEPTGIPQYYLEVTSGKYAGYNFDIVSNTTSQVTLDTAPPDLLGASVQVRRHITMGQIATGSSGLTSNVDSATIFNPDGTQLDISWDGTNWVDLNNYVYGDSYVIYPGTGFVLNTASQVKLNNTGLVKKTPTVVPVFPGVVNLISTMKPQVGASVGLGVANFGQYLSKNTDTLSTFKTVSGQLQVDYDAFMWTDGEIPGTGIWADLNNYVDATANTIDYAQPVVISVNSPTIVVLPAAISN